MSGISRRSLLAVPIGIGLANSVIAKEQSVVDQVITGTFEEKLPAIMSRPIAKANLIDPEAFEETHKVVRVGADNIQVMFDTGASVGFIDAGLANRFKFKALRSGLAQSAGGSVQVSSVKAALEFGEAEISMSAEFVVRDLKAASQANILVGMNILKDFDANFYRRRKLVEIGKNLALPKGARQEAGFFGAIFPEQPSETFSPMVEVVVSGPVAGSPSARVRALIDTGATSSMIDETIARRLGLKPLGTGNFSGLEGTFDRPVYNTAIQFPAAERVAISPLAGAPNMLANGYDVLLGWTVLSNWSIHVFRRQNIVRLISDPLI